MLGFSKVPVFLCHSVFICLNACLFMSLYLKPVYLSRFLSVSLYVCVCPCGAIGQCALGSSPFPGCIFFFINVGLKHGNTRTEITHSTFPPIGSETIILVLDRHSHRLLDRMHRTFFTSANKISREQQMR